MVEIEGLSWSWRPATDLPTTTSTSTSTTVTCGTQWTSELLFRVVAIATNPMCIEIPLFHLLVTIMIRLYHPSPEQCGFSCDADAAGGTLSFTVGVNLLYDNVFDDRWVFSSSSSNAAGYFVIGNLSFAAAPRYILFT
jgi:hypothetical protein